MVVISALGKEAYIAASGLHGLRLIKNLAPLQTSPVRKIVRGVLNKCAMLQLLWMLVYSSQDLRL
jgi:hypothetical protein